MGEAGGAGGVGATGSDAGSWQGKGHGHLGFSATQATRGAVAYALRPMPDANRALRLRVVDGRARRSAPGGGVAACQAHVHVLLRTHAHSV